MLKKLLFILLILPAINVKSQALIIFDSTQNLNYNFSYSPDLSSESLPNYFIKIMTDGDTIENRSYLNLKLLIITKIIKLNSNSYQIKIQIDSVEVYNTLNYNGFTLNNLIFPRIINLKFALVEKNTQLSFDIKSHSSFEILSKEILDTLIIDESKKANYAIQNLSVSFNFADSQKIIFDSSFSLIEKYINSKPNLFEIKRKLEYMESIKTGMIRLYNIDLKDIELKLQKENPHKYISDDALITLPNEGLFALYDSLVVKTKNTRKRFDRLINMPEYEFFNDGYQAWRVGNIDLAIMNFKKSINQKKDFAPPFYYLAEIEFQKQNWDSCSKTILYILNVLKPDFSTRKNTLALGVRMYDQISNEAEILLSESNLNEAIKILLIAESLCNSSNELVCSGRATILLKTAKESMFNSWKSITDKSISSKNVDLSISYLLLTQSFFRENISYLSDENSIDLLSIRLIDLLIINAQKKNNTGKYEKSLKYTSLADSLSTATNFHKYDTEIERLKTKSISRLAYKNSKNKANIASESKINDEKLTDLDKNVIQKNDISNDNKTQQKLYNLLISNALQFLKIGDYVNALATLEDAQKIEIPYSIKINDSLPTYIQKAALPVLMEKLKNANLLVIARNYEAAIVLVDSVKEKALKTNLHNDSNLFSEIANIENIVLKNKCNEASKIFSDNLLAAENNLVYMDFKSAEKNWISAAEIVENYNHCGLKSDIPLRKLETYKNEIEYSKKLAKADSLATCNQDSIAFEAFVNAINYYENKNLKDKKIIKPNVLEFSKKHIHSIEIQYFALNNIANNKDYNNLIDAINTMLIYQSLQPKYRILLIHSTKILADLDFENLETKNSKDLSKYRFPNKTEVYLKKIYLKEFRQKSTKIAKLLCFLKEVL